MEKLAKQLEKKLDLANVLKIKEKTDNELENRLKYCTQGSTHQNQLVLEPSWRRTKKISNPSTAPAPIKSGRYRTNSYRPVRAPSCARIPDCTFCRIVSPDEHNQIIFQNELLVIFDDIKKIKNVNHLLAVPKNHIKDINKAGFLEISEPRKRSTYLVMLYESCMKT